ncbi:MAG: hypothetical protein EOO24_32425, partial [Comamonadaceae bacterium]
MLDQALIYQCACPAQVCRALFELREAVLHRGMRLLGGDGDGVVHAPVVVVVVGAVALVVVQLAQFEQRAADLCRAGALVD